MADPYWPIPIVHPRPSQPPGLHAPAGKRLRSDLDSSTDQPYVPQEANRGPLHAIKDVMSINASYERYLSPTQMSSETGELPVSARPPARVSGHPFDRPWGINSLDYEGRRDESGQDRVILCLLILLVGTCSQCLECLTRLKIQWWTSWKALITFVQESTMVFYALLQVSCVFAEALIQMPL